MTVHGGGGIIDNERKKGWGYGQGGPRSLLAAPSTPALDVSRHMVTLPVKDDWNHVGHAKLRPILVYEMEVSVLVALPEHKVG